MEDRLGRAPLATIRTAVRRIRDRVRPILPPLTIAALTENSV
jgi:hypothetical protein